MKDATEGTDVPPLPRLNGGSSGVDMSESSGGRSDRDLISGRLRKRQANSEENDLPEGFVPLSTFCVANVSMHLPVARVRAGRFELGYVIGLPSPSVGALSETVSEAENVQEEKSTWRVLYERKREVNHSFTELRYANNVNLYPGSKSTTSIRACCVCDAKGGICLSHRL